MCPRRCITPRHAPYSSLLSLPFFSPFSSFSSSFSSLLLPFPSSLRLSFSSSLLLSHHAPPHARRAPRLHLYGDHALAPRARRSHPTRHTAPLPTAAVAHPAPSRRARAARTPPTPPTTPIAAVASPRPRVARAPLAPRPHHRRRRPPRPRVARAPLAHPPTPPTTPIAAVAHHGRASLAR